MRTYRRWILRRDRVRQRYHISNKTLRERNYTYDRSLRSWQIRRIIAPPPPPPPPPPKKWVKIHFSIRFSYIRGTRHDYYLDLNGVMVTRERDPRSLKNRIEELARGQYANTDYNWALDNADKVDVIISSKEETDFYTSPTMRVRKLQRL